MLPPSPYQWFFQLWTWQKTEIKPAYISKVIPVLKQYHDELVRYLEKAS